MVQILCVDISRAHEGDYRRLYEKASPERKARAEGFRKQEDALRCVASDALLRMALTDTFGHWEGHRICQTNLGKPFLEGQPQFHFSISHSGAYAALAYGHGELGLDVQVIEEKRVSYAFARRFFTEEETAFLARQSDFAHGFFRIWTAKESYIKYLGTGLQTPLHSFSVLSPEEGLHYHWLDLPGASLCLCAKTTEYQFRMLPLTEL